MQILAAIEVTTGVCIALLLSQYVFCIHVTSCMRLMQILGAIVVTAGVCTAAAPAQGGVGVLTEVWFSLCHMRNLANIP